MQTNEHNILPVTSQFLTRIFGSVEEGVKALYFLINTTGGKKGILVHGGCACGKGTLGRWIQQTLGNHASYTIGSDWGELENRRQRAEKVVSVIDEFYVFSKEFAKEYTSKAFIVMDNDGISDAMLTPNRYLLLSQVSFKSHHAKMHKVYQVKAGYPNIVIPDYYPSANSKYPGPPDLLSALLHEGHLQQWYGGNWPDFINPVEFM